MDAMEERFAQAFGHHPAYRGRAHGCVPLLGGLSDGGGELSLYGSLPQSLECRLGTRGDDLVWAIYIDERGEEPVEVFRLGQESRSGTWLDGVQALTAYLKQTGTALTGFELLVTSQLGVLEELAPRGALGAALLRALRDAFGLAIEDHQIAETVFLAEVAFAGRVLTRTESFLATLTDHPSALVIDTRTNRYEKYRWPQDFGCLFVFDTGGRPTPEDDVLLERRRQCAKAAARLGLEAVSDIGVDEIRELDLLPEPYERRARHVVLENARVVKAVRALREHHQFDFLECIRESQASLTALFDASTRLGDALIEAASEQPETKAAHVARPGPGSRVCVFSVPELGLEDRRKACASYVQRVLTSYQAKTGTTALCLVSPDLELSANFGVDVDRPSIPI